MRILHVIGSLSPADGGPPEAVRQLARAYPKIGVDVEVLCQDLPDAPFLAPLTFPVHALGQRWLGRFGLSPRLWQWLHRSAARFDGIVMNGLWIFADIAVRSAALRAGTPYAVFPHGSLDPWFNRKYPLKHLKKLIYWPLQYPVLRDARAVLFTTATERDLARTSFRPNRWNGIPVSYGISHPSGEPAAQIEAFHAKFPALRGRRYLLFMSRLHEKKGCDLLVDAFARLASEFPDVDLVVAGPDPVSLQAKLQERAARNGIADRVHWPGMLTGDLKWGALRSAEAFVLPSHQENFGIVVAESLAAGRPVLISNQVNIWPDIQADGAGLVDDDTLKGAESLLRRWLALTPVEREAMAAHAQPCFSSRYSMERAAASVKALFSPSGAEASHAGGPSDR
ncbi:MAG TPA: glycosyltransferase [Acidobacteriaceae bacterium]|jgi:glycosyltransferase involved in cell wall biosynthesis|nr:glycosyltransferase [Acidobacteriaceae bacterium]